MALGPPVWALSLMCRIPLPSNGVVFSQAPPTELVAAGCALHVVAAVILLDAVVAILPRTLPRDLLHQLHARHLLRFLHLSPILPVRILVVLRTALPFVPRDIMDDAVAMTTRCAPKERRIVAVFMELAVAAAGIHAPTEVGFIPNRAPRQQAVEGREGVFVCEYFDARVRQVILALQAGGMVPIALFQA